MLVKTGSSAVHDSIVRFRLGEQVSLLGRAHARNFRTGQIPTDKLRKVMEAADRAATEYSRAGSNGLISEAISEAGFEGTRQRGPMAVSMSECTRSCGVD